MKSYLVHVASPKNLHLTLGVDAPTAEAAGAGVVDRTDDMWLAARDCVAGRAN